MIVYVVLTEACNLACPHCIRGKQRDVFMPSADFSRIVNQLNQNADISAVILTGGEPLIHPDFFNILADTFKIFSRRVVITSNGTLNIPSVLDRVASENQRRLSIQISLDGTMSVNDSIRGAGSYTKILTNVTRLNDLGFTPSIATTVSVLNYNNIIDLAWELSRFRILRWSVNLATPMGRCTRETVIGIEEWNDLVDRIRKLQLPYSLNIKKLFDMEFLDKLSDADLRRAETLFIDRHLRNCSIGGGKLYIYPDLSVCACTCLSALPIGRLDEKTFADIISSVDFKKVACCRMALDSPCRRCRYATLCNGGCPGISYTTFGSIGIGDKRCPRFRELADEQGLLF